MKLPGGYHLTRGAKSQIDVKYDEALSGNVKIEVQDVRTDENSSLAFEVEYADAKEGDSIDVTALVYFCQDEDVCLSRRIKFRTKIVGNESEGEKDDDVVRFVYAIPKPEPEMSFAADIPQFN